MWICSLETHSPASADNRPVHPMAENQTLKDLYTAVDRRQSGSTANAISQRLRAEYKIATGEGMVGNRELLDSISALNVTADSRLVDLGSGTAEPSRWIARMTGCRLTAVDVSSDRLARIPTIDAIHAVCTDLNAGLHPRLDLQRMCAVRQHCSHLRPGRVPRRTSTHR